MGGFEFQVEDLTGRCSAALNEATQALIAEARKQPELDARQIFTSFSTSTPQFKYDLDRNKAKLLGLSLPDVFNTLQIYLGSLYVNDFNLFGRTFRVTMQADKDARAAPTDISRLYVRNSSGGMVPLSTLGSLKPTVGPETVVSRWPSHACTSVLPPMVNTTAEMYVVISAPPKPRPTPTMA